MKIELIRRQLLASTIFAGAVAIAAPAFAQQDPNASGATSGPVEGQLPTAADSGTAETPDASGAGDIVVTGSRIRSPNLESASPITVVNSEAVKLSGTTRTEDLLNSLPQVFAGQGSNVSNGSDGTASINLRGLGAERNLVLVNGRRVVPGDPGTSAVDINVIPAALIKRVDLLTGGASAVYGADAVTGVINFVMDTDFEGFRVDSQYSFYQHTNDAQGSIRNALNAGNGRFPYPDGSVADGGAIDATAVFGTSFDDGRGHITAYGGYRRIGAVLQGRRDYSACALSGNVAGSAAGKYSCSGSANSANGSFIIFDSADPADPTSVTSTFFQVGNGRNFIPGSTPYNFNPVNFFQRPDERYTAGFFANYEISDKIKPYAEFMFMDDRTTAQIAASGTFIGNTTSINCDNPLLSAQQLALVCDNENLLVTPNPLTGQAVVGQAFQGNPNFTDTTPQVFTDPVTGASYNKGFLQFGRRNVEGGGRQDDRQHTSYRGVIGAKGDLGKAFSYDAYYQYGRTVFSETYNNDFSVSRITKALDVVQGPNGPVCRSVLTGTDPNCVPYDVFNNAPISGATLAYLVTPGFQRGIVSEQVASGSISGALGQYGIKTPWSEEGIGFSIGAEYRKERLEFLSDLEFQTGDLAGQGAPTLPVSGQFDVREAFGELRVPIVHDSFIYDLTFTGGYRYSDYQVSTGGGYKTDTYKLQGEFSPIRDIKFRGGYNRAVRAPTVQDLFAPQRVALDGSSDPCAGKVITAADQGCILQGLAIGQKTPLNPASQYNGLIGGNTNLVPEVADSYTAGVVLQPRFLPRFSLTVDYFDIKIKKAVTTIGADTILNACNQSLDPGICGLINRDGSGSLWLSSAGFVTDLTQNIGGLSTKGIDVDASYSLPVGSFGTLGASFVGTYLKDLITDTGVTGSFNCKGYFGNVCGTPNPKWRHTARVNFNMNNGIGASVRWRYFDGVKIDGLSSNPNLTAPTRPGNLRLPSVSYIDLTLTARIAENYNFRIGANNVFDKDPPVNGSQVCPAGPCNGNTWAQVYDALGRYIFAGVTLDF